MGLGIEVRMDFEDFGLFRSSHLSFGGWRFGCGVLTRIEIHSFSCFVSFVIYYSCWQFVFKLPGFSFVVLYKGTQSHEILIFFYFLLGQDNFD